MNDATVTTEREAKRRKGRKNLKRRERSPFFLSIPRSLFFCTYFSLFHLLTGHHNGGSSFSLLWLLLSSLYVFCVAGQLQLLFHHLDELLRLHGHSTLSSSSSSSSSSTSSSSVSSMGVLLCGDLNASVDCPIGSFIKLNNSDNNGPNTFIQGCFRYEVSRASVSCTLP